MTLEEINDVEDKDLRLALLTQHIADLLQAERNLEEIAADAQRGATRDEAFGMMSRFGKPEDN